MGEGSIRGSIFTICSIAVGAGALSLPFVVAQLGWVLGGSMLTIAAFTSVWSLNIIVQCANRTQVMDYSKLCHEVLGKPGLIAAQICQISYLFGACTSFQIIITQLIQYVMYHSNLASKDFTYGIGTFIVITLITNYLVIVPLSLIENLHGFRYISLIAIASIIYCDVVLIAQLPSYYEANYRPGRAVEASWNIFTFLQGFAICVFAFNCQNHILPIYQELERKSTRRITKVISRSVFIMWFLYFTIAFAGYFSSFENTAKIVLERVSLDGDHIDVSILIGIIALVILLLIHSPVNYFPCRLIIVQTFGGQDEFTTTQNYIVTFCFFTCAVIVSIIFPNITSVLSIIGGLCACTQSYVLPTLVYVKLSTKRLGHWKNLGALLIGITVGLLGYASVVTTVMQNIDPSLAKSAPAPAAAPANSTAT